MRAVYAYVKQHPLGSSLAAANILAPIADAGTAELGPPIGIVNVELSQPMGWPEATMWIIFTLAACFLIALWIRAMNGRL